MVVHRLVDTQLTLADCSGDPYSSPPMTTPDAKLVAAWLRERRKAAGKTQMALAAEIGVGKRSIERWERGESAEHIATVLRLLSALGYDIGAPGAEVPQSLSAELAELRRVVEENAKDLRELVLRFPGGAEALAAAEAQERDQAHE